MNAITMALMIIWTSTGYSGGLTSEVVTMEECLGIKEMAFKDNLMVFCYPLRKEQRT